MAKKYKRSEATGALGKGLDTLIGSESAPKHNEALPNTNEVASATVTEKAKPADSAEESVEEAIAEAVEEAEYRTTVAVLTATNENERREDRAITMACRLIGLGAAGAIAVAACTIAGTKAIFSMKR